MENTFTQAHARALLTIIAEQSFYWDPARGEMYQPEAKLHLAVLGQALTDLLFLYTPAPQESCFNEKRKYASAMVKHRGYIREASDALDFLTTKRLNHSVGPLGVEASWVRRMVKGWVNSNRPSTQIKEAAK